MSEIGRYLAELRRALPFWTRGRVLAEVEDHLRASAAAVGEQAAVARFGPARDVARGFRHVAALQVAAGAALLALLFPILSYPLVESALPPAPWPSAAAMPDSLQWKLDAIKAFYLVALGAGAVAAFSVRKPGRDLVLACAVVLAALAHVGALSTMLSVQWEGAVPGTPGWLRLVAVAQLAATFTAAAMLVRAARARPV